MRSPARQPGRISGAPANAAFSLIGVVEDGTSFHASFKGRLCPEADFSAAVFPLDTPPEVDRMFPRGISARGRLVPTSKSRHLKKADEG